MNEELVAKLKEMRDRGWVATDYPIYCEDVATLDAAITALSSPPTKGEAVAFRIRNGRGEWARTHPAIFTSREAAQAVAVKCEVAVPYSVVPLFTHPTPSVPQTSEAVDSCAVVLEQHGEYQAAAVLRAHVGDRPERETAHNRLSRTLAAHSWLGDDADKITLTVETAEELLAEYRATTPSVPLPTREQIARALLVLWSGGSSLLADGAMSDWGGVRRMVALQSADAVLALFQSPERADATAPTIDLQRFKEPDSHPTAEEMHTVLREDAQ